MTAFVHLSFHAAESKLTSNHPKIFGQWKTMFVSSSTLLKFYSIWRNSFSNLKMHHFPFRKIKNGITCTQGYATATYRIKSKSRNRTTKYYRISVPVIMLYSTFPGSWSNGILTTFTVLRAANVIRSFEVRSFGLIHRGSQYEKTLEKPFALTACVCANFIRILHSVGKINSASKICDNFRGSWQWIPFNGLRKHPGEFRKFSKCWVHKFSGTGIFLSRYGPVHWGAVDEQTLTFSVQRDRTTYKMRIGCYVK